MEDFGVADIYAAVFSEDVSGTGNIAFILRYLKKNFICVRSKVKRYVLILLPIPPFFMFILLARCDKRLSVRI